MILRPLLCDHSRVGPDPETKERGGKRKGCTLKPQTDSPDFTRLASDPDPSLSPLGCQVGGGALQQGCPTPTLLYFLQELGKVTLGMEVFTTYPLTQACFSGSSYKLSPDTKHAGRVRTFYFLVLIPALGSINEDLIIL